MVIPTRVHGVLTQNDIIQIFIAMKISHLIQDVVTLMLLKQRNLPDQNNNRCTIIIQYTDIIIIHNLPVQTVQDGTTNRLVTWRLNAFRGLHDTRGKKNLDPQLLKSYNPYETHIIAKYISNYSV